MFTSADGNNAVGALSPASQSQDLAQQVRDNEGIVGNEQAFDLSTHSFTVCQQPSIQPPVDSQPVYDMSLHSSPDALQPTYFCGASFFRKQVMALHRLVSASPHGEITSRSRFTVVYYNCRSMLPKFDELVAVCQDIVILMCVLWKLGLAVIFWTVRYIFQVTQL